MGMSSRAGPIVPQLLTVPMSDAHGEGDGRTAQRRNNTIDHESVVSNVSQPQSQDGGEEVTREAKGGGTRTNLKRLRSDGVLGVVRVTSPCSRSKLSDRKGGHLDVDLT